MIKITLPDQSVKELPVGSSVADVAASIGAGLRKAAIAGVVNGQEVDLHDPIHADATVSILTSKDDAGVDIIRHTCAHLLGHALKQLYPDAKMVIGPVIENGFYYDIDCEHRFSPDDLAALEKRMVELAKTGYEVVKKMTPIAEAREIFAQRGEDYKMRLIDEMDDSVQEVGLYYHQEYLDMCRGPHLPDMSFIKAFELTKLAGAYWRGDANNEQLQRIYGVAFADKKALKAYLEMMEEAEKRDHRKLGRQLDLFHFQPEASGMVFWHDKGYRVFRTLESFVRRMNEKYGFAEVSTPQMMDRSLWEKSGHWGKYEGGMYTTHIDDRDYAIKPMNCPGHVQIYNHDLRSYKDLPLRMAEFGVVHRIEASGTLHGLMRLRRFTQDDSHIFCLPEQIKSEVGMCIQMLKGMYRQLGFDTVDMALSLRPELRVGSEEIWDKAENALREAIEANTDSYTEQPGEGAFYGPKIDFNLKDSIGRSWQCGTIQLDFSMPNRLDAQYVTENNEKDTPVMIHFAKLGSLERFLGILIENHAGNLPFWLAPVKATVLNISEKQADYVPQVVEKLRENGFFVDSDLRNEKIGYKIREHSTKKTPFLLVVGDKEMESDQVAVRRHNGEDLGAMSIADVVSLFKQENTQENTGAQS